MKDCEWMGRETDQRKDVRCPWRPLYFSTIMPRDSRCGEEFYKAVFTRRLRHTTRCRSRQILFHYWCRHAVVGSASGSAGSFLSRNFVCLWGMQR